MPSRLGPYRVLRKLATGGMGELYLAQLDGPAGFSKRLAIKRILPHLAWDERFVELFLEEARLAAALSHPNVVQIFELGQHEGAYYIAMEYVRGRSLRAVLRKLQKQGRLVHPAVAARIASQVLQGLHHAHQMKNRKGELRPIVHRDISPENVLISVEGAVKVVDFGIAKAVDPSVQRLTGLLHGKLSYMSLEQLERRPVEPRTDVYGVAVLLFELLTGEPPYSADSSQQLRAQMKAGHASVSERQPVPQWLVDIVERGLSLEVERRFASAEEMALAIEEQLRTVPDAPSPPELGRLLVQLFGPELEELPPQANAVGTRPLEGTGEALTDSERAAAEVVPASGTLTGMNSTEPHRPAFAPRLVMAAAAVIAFVSLGAALLKPSPEALSRPLPTAASEQPSTLAAKPDAPAPSFPPAMRVSPVLTAVDPPPLPARSNDAPPRTMASTPSKKRVRSFGTLDLRVHPWAEVYWNRRRLGITPLAPLRLPAGKQTVTLRNKELATERRYVVEVPANGEARLEVNLLTSRPQGTGSSLRRQ